MAIERTRPFLVSPRSPSLLAHESSSLRPRRLGLQGRVLQLTAILDDRFPLLFTPSVHGSARFKMLRLSRPSTSSHALRVFQRSFSASTACRADGLFPPSSAPKEELDRFAQPPSTPLGLPPAEKRRLPQLKGMEKTPGGLDRIRQKSLPAAIEEDELAESPASASEPTSEVAPPAAVAPTPSATSTSVTPPPPSDESSVLSAILASPILNPATSKSNLSLGSAYLPTSSYAPTESALRSKSIFRDLPSPPPTYTLNVNYKVSRNNVIATLAYAHDGSIIKNGKQISAGTVGFRKAAQGGYEAGHQVALAVMRLIREENGRRLREKRDFKKIWYREKAEERRQELITAFEGLKEQQLLLAAAKEALEMESKQALAAPSSAASPQLAAPTPASKPTTYAAAVPLSEVTDETAVGSTKANSPAPAPEQQRPLHQRKAAIAVQQKALGEQLAAYNSSVRTLSSELRDLQNNRIPADLLMPKVEVDADVSTETISEELAEAENQAGSDVGVFFKVHLKGFGQGREAFLKALTGREGYYVRPLCTGLGDNTPQRYGPSLTSLDRLR